MGKCFIRFYRLVKEIDWISAGIPGDSDSPEQAYHFIRWVFSGQSIHHVRDPLKAALTKEGFEAILNSQPMGRAFTSLENPGLQATVTTPLK